MICKLNIKNFALIENLEIDLSSGFSVWSGETGSGKSIILDAISLILGKRSDRGTLFDKNKKCIIEADVMIDSSRKALFELYNLDYEKITNFRREITPSGKSRSFINDTPVSLSILQHISSNFIEIYSQFQSNSLKIEEKQIEMIDKLSSSSAILKNYQDIFHTYNDLRKKIEQMERDHQMSDAEEEYLKYQISEIESSNLLEGEKEKIESKLFLLENSSSIVELMSESYSLLSEDNGVNDSLLKIQNRLNKLSGSSKEITNIQERFSSLIIEINDLENEIKTIHDNIDLDPAILNKHIDRIDQINNLLSKHGKSNIRELLDLLEEMKIRLISSSDYQNILLKETEKLKLLEDSLLNSAKMLRKSRSKVIPGFKKSIENYLKKLGIKDPVFDVLILEREEFSLNGKDSIRFMFSANKGSDPQEIHKVASGGELSRLLLCCSYLVSEYDDLSCIIFDEIDTGVSGEIAYLMSDMMKSMSSEKQIISVTHLPQIASKADAHFKVYKIEDNNRTVSKIKKLVIDERVEEIAKMLSGKTVTEVSISNAKELLSL